MKITLKAARINANLTQKEAAKKIGVTKPTICNWENGQSYPTVIQFKKIEQVYGVSYDSINFSP